MENQQHPFSGETVLFATKHGKEEILSPLFSELEMSCRRADVDTDLFGTFSGEVERSGSIRETLRRKINAASELAPSDVRFIIASEGSFGPHPFLGLIQTDLESLLLRDRKLDVEIYAEYFCTKPVHGEKILGPRDDFRSALKGLGFPEHAVIVHPEKLIIPIFKGLRREVHVAQAMLECFVASKNGRVVIASDLRANHNPTRRKAIFEAGKALLAKLRCFCPSCAYPGFAITRGIPGLPCEVCLEPSRDASKVLMECAKCDASDERPRPDGKKFLDPAECEFCNP